MPKCEKCHDTGKLSVGTGKFVYCMFCDAPVADESAMSEANTEQTDAAAVIEHPCCSCDVVSKEAYDQQAEELREAREELSKYRDGYKGGCYACEPVGTLNQELSAQLTEKDRVIREYVEATSEELTSPMRILKARQGLYEIIGEEWV